MNVGLAQIFGGCRCWLQITNYSRNTTPLGMPPAVSMAVPNREGLSVTLLARQSRRDRHTARMTFVVHIAAATSGRFNNPA